MNGEGIKMVPDGRMHFKESWMHFLSVCKLIQQNLIIGTL